jgi:hypothetical protein
MVDVQRDWENAKDAVDYPVHIVPAFYQDEDSLFVNANGETNTGRDKDFNLVVVDRLRDGDKQVIACVSGLYGSLKTTDVYAQLQNELLMSDNKNHVDSLYISGNGGVQQLTVAMDDMISMSGAPDELSMKIRLETSVDGSKAHSLSMVATNETGDIGIHVYGGEYRLSARHTTTINDRTFHYIPTVNQMIANWNEVIIPTMSLMYDEKFNRNVALNMVDELCKTAKIGERHQKAIRDLYVSGLVRTNDTTDSMYKMNVTFNQYFDDNMEEKTELRNKFKDGIAKAMHNELNKLRKK